MPSLERAHSRISVHDEPTASAFASSAAKSLPNLGSSTAEGDYVWDVFYHRPATLVEWNDVANIGKLSAPLWSCCIRDTEYVLEPGYPLALVTFTIPRRTLMEKLAMKPTRTQTVPSLYPYHLPPGY